MQKKERMEKFISGLNFHLDTVVDISERRVPDKTLRQQWREQNYTPVKKFGKRQRQQLAGYSVYRLVNKIFFYYVIKHSFTTLPGIIIPEGMNNIYQIKGMIEDYFVKAQKVSGDFEGVFEKHEVDKIIFVHGDLVNPIKSLINYVVSYIDRMTQDAFGTIYDRMISPEQRRRYGQYYTDIHIVNLMNALTIKDSNAKVLDPSAGPWTFGVKAFDLKMKLAGRDSKELREKMLGQILGVEISPYPIQIAIMSMVGRLMFLNPSKYPKIIKKDFLQVNAYEIVSRGGKRMQIRFMPIDAVVSNLPFIRQENIKNKEGKIGRVKQMLKKHGYPEEGPGKSSDFHVYFWYYILPFLKEGSRVGFLTSDTWMNTRYGEELKRFVNRYYKIVAIIDSSVERWFKDPQVNTIITILERTEDKKERECNKIKFVRINKKIADVVPDLDAAIKVANDIEHGTSHRGVTIIREVRQGDIDFNDKTKAKLSPYLKAPDIFFKLLNAKHMVPLERLLDIRYGIKSGADDWFFVEDVTSCCSEEEIYKQCGMRRNEMKKKRLRLIKDGRGKIHVIEAEYRKPILKTPTEYTSLGTLVIKGKTRKYIVLIRKNGHFIKEKDKVKKYGRKYIEYGETFPIKTPFFQNKCKQGKTPWKISPIIIPNIVLPRCFWKSFIHPKATVLVNESFYSGNLRGAYKDDLTSVYAFLNSSLSYMYPDLYGIQTGGGAVPLYGREKKLLPVPDPRVMRPYYKLFESIMKQMEMRGIGTVFDEIWNGKGVFSLKNVKQDRLALDRTILKAIGIKEPDEFLKKWYPAIIKMVEERLNKKVTCSASY